jgi:hypothetical protein
VAKPGTVTRSVIDWFNDERAAPKTFDIGWQAFQPGSIEPSAETQVRLDRFAGEMRAADDVNATLRVCTRNGDASALERARSRAKRLIQMLVAARIEPSRISAVICRLPGTKNLTSSASAQDGETIGITLEHRLQGMD